MIVRIVVNISLIVCCFFSCPLIEATTEFSECPQDRSIDYFLVLQNIDLVNKHITTDDGSTWRFKEIVEDWQPGHRLKIAFVKGLGWPIRIKNIDDPNAIILSGMLKTLGPKPDTILRLPSASSSQIVLKSGRVFSVKGDHSNILRFWSVDDRVFLFHDLELDNTYSLSNLDNGKQGLLFGLSPSEGDAGNTFINHSVDIVRLRKVLSERIIGQPEAVEHVMSGIVNAVSGLKDPKKPIGTFLFLGPTGVGKTELAKVLGENIYYPESRVIRFDMSQFSASHTVANLIGSPIGYVNHEEGGQLINALKKQPKSVVIFDEIEKAHSEVHKLFLHVFDEGYITDSKGEQIYCRDAIFILTSNLCAGEISSLLKDGYDREDALGMVEPTLMSILSPELYNRIDPVIFNSITPEMMVALVDRFLNDLAERLLSTKSIHLVFDLSAKEYLIEMGYHPTLGARPLKKLIDKKVVAAISQELLKRGMPLGGTLTIYYSSFDDSWVVQ